MNQRLLILTAGCQGDVQPDGAWGIGATGAMALGYQLY